MVRAGLRLLGLARPGAGAGGDHRARPRRRRPPTRLAARHRVAARRTTPPGAGSRSTATSTCSPCTASRSTGACSRPGDRLELRARPRRPARGRPRRCSLLRRGGRDARCRPRGTPTRPTCPPPATLRWTAVGPDGAEEPVDRRRRHRRAAPLRAGRGCRGRRCGTGSAATAAGCVRPCATACLHRAGADRRGRTPNAVVARHLVPAARRRRRPARRACCRCPGQRLRVPGTAGPARRRPRVTPTLTPDRARRRRRTTGVAVADWVGVGPGDRVFVVDRERGELRFGDGSRGPGPAAGRGRAAPQCATARRRRRRQPRPARAPGRRRAAPGRHQPGAAPRGAPTPRRSRRPGSAPPTSWRAPDRTVTRPTTSRRSRWPPQGSAWRRAHVSPGHHPGFPCVDVPGALTVTVVPGGRPRPLTGRRLDRGSRARPGPPRGGASPGSSAARLLGQEVFVGRTALPRGPGTASTVTRSAATTRCAARVTEALRRHLDPLAGGADGRRLAVRRRRAALRAASASPAARPGRRRRSRASRSRSTTARGPTAARSPDRPARPGLAGRRRASTWTAVAPGGGGLR